MSRMPRKLLVAVAVSLIAVVSAWRPAQAVWNHDVSMPTTLASPGVLAGISTWTGMSDGAGGYLLAWSDNRLGNMNIYAQHVDATGAALWGAGGLLVCNAAGNQEYPQVVTDGSGGVIIVWVDSRAGNFDLYAARVTSAGALPWAANGAVVCNAAGMQTGFDVESNGFGGVFVTWLDFRNGAIVGGEIYAHELGSAGLPLFAANGQVVCSVNNDNPGNPSIMPDPQAGYSFLTWSDGRNAGTTGRDLYMQRLNPGGVPQWGLNGIVLCNASGLQDNPVPVVSNLPYVPFDAGFVTVAWRDERGGPYAQRVEYSGTKQWTANGVALSNAGQPYASGFGCFSDGSAGAVVAWNDDRNNLFAQRVDRNGNVKWAANGVAASTPNNGLFHYPFRTVPDGQNGVILSYSEDPGDGPIVRTQRIDVSGNVLWHAQGVKITNFPSYDVPTMVGSSNGSAIVLLADALTGNLVGQRVSPTGYVGEIGPALLSVKDVLNDQGGKVKVVWNASEADIASPFNVTEYWVFRSVPSAAVAEGVLRGARVVHELVSEPLPGERVFLMKSAVDPIAWEFLGSSPAFRSFRYSFVASTTSDSMAGSNPLTMFMVQSRSAAAPVNSDPDSGYSVDNIAPPAPAAFSVQWFPGSAPVSGTLQATTSPYAWLHWARSTAADFLEYRVYRGPSPDFVPSPANQIAVLGDTGFVDVGAPPSYYKLVVRDLHGNSSTAGVAVPPNTLDAPGDVALRIALESPFPNPSPNGFVVRFSLPTRAEVRLSVFDVSGRRLAELVREPLSEGPHEARWNGRDALGNRVAQGLYFLRLDALDRTICRRLAVSD